ncbi:MAG: glutamyl-tRNA reductase [Verrucomicrobiae bacterium]|nr:glutamyl-tRNA reductase [Verrucomicrobiae bacterium]
MSIFCLGVNHKTAPVELRERLAIAEHSVPSHLGEICGIEGIEEAVVLSTCNRVEIYGASALPEEATDRLIAYLESHFAVAPGEIDFYRQTGESAAHHLFEVASGLDSMVLGETEIFGQVKKAYAIAQETGTTARRMNKLFQQSFSVGKLVRSGSSIQQGSTSVGSAAVDLAEKIFGRLDGCRVMIIGAGEMSRTTAQSLLSRGARSIIVSNRSYDKAVELAAELKGEAIRFDDWETRLDHVDIIVSSTSAPHAVVHAPMIRRVMERRRGHSLFLIDIAVPRDIEEEVNEIDNVYLYNIDQLQQIASEGKARRERQIAICRDLIAAFLREKGIEALAGTPEDRAVREEAGKRNDSPGRALPQS